ncbi:MAG: Na/Pi symporter [Xanthomonadales bacterium]|nr:Na/Pi symporter [Xanthomonadales bacterium]
MAGRSLPGLLGGLGLFLLGMGLLTEGLKLAAGSSLARILRRATAGPGRALASGALITALVQSSSAVTLATIGFVNAGLMPLGGRALGALRGQRRHQHDRLAGGSDRARSSRSRPWPWPCSASARFCGSARGEGPASASATPSPASACCSSASTCCAMSLSDLAGRLPLPDGDRPLRGAGAHPARDRAHGADAELERLDRAHPHRRPGGACSAPSAQPPW